jgi:hypothetical protein
MPHGEKATVAADSVKQNSAEQMAAAGFCRGEFSTTTRQHHFPKTASKRTPALPLRYPIDLPIGGKTMYIKT